MRKISHIKQPPKITNEIFLSQHNFRFNVKTHTKKFTPFSEYMDPLLQHETGSSYTEIHHKNFCS